MSVLFWIHAAIVIIGLIISTWNLLASLVDLRIVKERRVGGEIEFIAYGWVVREMIHFLIQGVFLSFIVLFIVTPHEDDLHYRWIYQTMEMRSVWISGFVCLLSLWDRFIRVKLL